jgi:myo-inositol-1(or 4)-monophosphatase
MQAGDEKTLGVLVDFIVRLGKEARARQGESIHAFKSDGSYVTEVDRRVEDELRNFLHQRFPQHRVLGEEGGLTGPSDGRWTWVIDPIDGTTNYALGLPVWAVSVGLLDGNTPYWGCIHIPVLDQLFLSRRGEGATRNGEQIAPCARTRCEREDLVGIASDGFKRYDYLFPQRVRAMGSAAAQVVFVACGYYVGYVLDNWHVWDIAAALLIAREAGVTVTDSSGKDFTAFTHVGPEEGPYLLFASPGIHDELLSLIAPKRPA